MKNLSYGVRRVAGAAIVCVVVCAAVLVSITTIHAGNSTLTYTSPQSTAIQTQLIPLYNKAHCARFNLGASCTSAQLVSSGCTNIVFKTVTLESCTIFTQDAAGEQAFLQEQTNQKLADVFTQLTNSDNLLFCVNFKAASVANQNSICSTIGLSNGCSPCP